MQYSILCVSGFIICGNSIESTRNSDMTAVRSILSAGNDCITCGIPGGGLIVGRRSQCDGSASDGNLTVGSASGSSLMTGGAVCSSLTIGSAGAGVGGW